MLRICFVLTTTLLLACSTLHSQPLTLGIGGGFEYGPARFEFTRHEPLISITNNFENRNGAPDIFVEAGLDLSSSLAVLARLSGSHSILEFAKPFPEVLVMIPVLPGGISPSEERLTFTLTRVTMAIAGR